MNGEKFSEAMSEIDEKYVNEAVGYKGKARMRGPLKWGIIAACLVLMSAAVLMFVSVPGGTVVSVYACGTDEEITGAGVVMSSGRISDTGEREGKPLMFYLCGEDIASVRFSCKNEQIRFTDWTEKREEYGNAGNFTVPYGADESEYYYLTIDWEPVGIIRELTDNASVTIGDLPEELRSDVIVMEITFENGETVTKAVEISLLDDGTFFASYGDYKISEEDAFVRRSDSEAIPREILYAQGAVSTGSTADAPPMVRIGDRLYKRSEDRKTSYEGPTDEFVLLGKIESVTGSDGNTADGVPKENFQANHPVQGAEVYRYGDGIVLKVDGEYWLYELIREESIPDTDGMLEEEKMKSDPSYGAAEDLSEAKEAAEIYYADTVFEVILMEEKSSTEEEIVFNVRVSKEGVVQEPDRFILLRREDGEWKVVNEGY